MYVVALVLSLLLSIGAAVTQSGHQSGQNTHYLTGGGDPIPPGH